MLLCEVPLLNSDLLVDVKPGLALAVVDYVVEDLDQFLCLRQAKRLFPKSFRLVSDDEDIRVIVFGFNVLAQLVKRPIDVLFLARQK